MMDSHRKLENSSSLISEIPVENLYNFFLKHLSEVLSVKQSALFFDLSGLKGYLKSITISLLYTRAY